MSSLWKKKLKQLLRRTTSSFLFGSGALRILEKYSQPTWRIFTYHRIINPESVWYPLQAGMYVRPETFERHIRDLSENANILSLTELTRRLVDQEKIPAKTIVITFDDGWVDNYTNAFPVLRKYNVPATIFLATQYIDSSSHFWTDILSSSLFSLWKEKNSLHKDALFEAVREGNDSQSHLEEDVRKILSLSTKKDIEEALEVLILDYKSFPRHVRDTNIKRLEKVVKQFVSFPHERSFLSWHEVQEMKKSGVSFASHSHAHRPLSELNEEELKEDLRQSLSLLEGQRISSSTEFCYPEGAYTNEAQKVLKMYGIQFALTTKRKTNLGTSPVLLGRIGIHEDVSNTLPLFACRIWGEYF